MVPKVLSLGTGSGGQRGLIGPLVHGPGHMALIHKTTFCSPVPCRIFSQAPPNHGECPEEVSGWPLDSPPP